MRPAAKNLGPMALWCGFAALAMVNYWPTLRWMVGRWDEPESYMSHGWLIPAIAGFLIWRERRDLPARQPGGIWGFLVFVLALILHLVSGIADVSSISGITLVLLILAFVAMVEGLPRFKALAFPIGFLVFMVPPPEFVISGINFKLKLVAADIACNLLNVTGLGAIREGSFMVFADQKLAIGDVCSGLRSLLALLSLGVLYAYLVRHRGWKQVLAILFAMIPAAILGNGIRICLVCYLVLWLGADRVFSPLIGSWDLHLFTGALIFASALGCLIGVTALMDALFPHSESKP